MGRLQAPGVRVLARGMSLEGGAWVLTLTLMSLLVTMTQPLPQQPHWSSLHVPVTCFKREVGGSWDGRVLGGRVRVEVGPACRQGHAFGVCSAGPLRRGAAGQGEDEAPGDDFVNHRSQLRLRGGRGSITSSNEQRGSVESQPAGDAGMHENSQQRIKVPRDDEGQAAVRAGTEAVEKVEEPVRSQSPRSRDARPRILADEQEQTLRLPELQLNGRTPSRQSRGESGQQQQEADSGRADGPIRIPRGDEILGSEVMEDERGDGDTEKEVSGDAVVAGGGGGGVASGDFDEAELAAASTSEGGDMLASVRELCLEGKVEDALELFRADLRNVSYPLCTNVMHEFADVGRSDLAQAALLHMQMLCVENGESLDTAVYNELMLAYARDEATATEDGLEQAFSVLEMMKRDDVAPDTLTYNRLMEACASAGEACDAWEKGLRVLDLMNEGGVKPVIETFNLLIEACGKCGWSKNTGNGLEKGSQILARMMEDKVNATTDTFNILMYGCAWAAGAGDGWSGVEQGLSFLEAMAEFNAMPDVITFNNLIAACAQAAGSGDGARARDQAFRLLETMRKVGLSPDQGTCDTLIATCAKAAAAGDSEGVDYGLKVLDMMKRAGMTPDEAMHNALLAECVKVAEAIHEEPSRRGWLAVEWMSRALSLIQVGQMDHSPYADKLVALCTNLVGELSYELTNLAARHRQPSPVGDGGSMSDAAVTAASEETPGAGAGASLRLPTKEDGAAMKLEKSWQLQRGAATDCLDYSQPAELFSQLQQLAAKQLQDLREHRMRATSQSPARSIMQQEPGEGEKEGGSGGEGHHGAGFAKMLAADDDVPAVADDRREVGEEEERAGRGRDVLEDYDAKAEAEVARGMDSMHVSEARDQASYPSSPSRSDGRARGNSRLHEASESEEASRKALRMMGVDAVCEWLDKEDLGELVPYFKEAGVDGAGLQHLKDLLGRDVEVFYSAAERNLKVTKFGLVLKLAGSLESLDTSIFTQADPRGP